MYKAPKGKALESMLQRTANKDSDKATSKLSS